MTDAFKSETIKKIVTDDYRAASIFEKFSLDFCCKGGVTVEQACSEKNIDPAPIFAALEQLRRQPDSGSHTFADWGPEELVSYIVKVHHAYVREAVPVIVAHTRKVASVHGANHPEVVKIAQHFEEVAQELWNHMMKEERILFPYVTALVQAKKNGIRIEQPPFGTAQNPIRMMEAEHQSAGDTLYAVRALSSNYTPPEDACTTYRVSYSELQHFERDLHQHVHLENNILFPKVLELEREMFDFAHVE